MSHFAVLVIGDDIESQLIPFCEHTEYGYEHFSFIDKTDEVLDDWENGTKKEWYPEDRVRVSEEILNMIEQGDEVEVEISDFVPGGFKEGKKYQLSHNRNKTVRNIYVDCLSVDSDNSKLVTLKKIDPPKEIPISSGYETIDSFAKNWYGYDKNSDGRYGYRANENAKWDWYQVGGRWTGFFRGKENLEGVIGVGEPGLMTSKARPQYYDSILKKDIDITYMHAEAANNAEKEFDSFIEVFGDIEIPSWNEIREKHGDNIDDAREEYHNTEFSKKLNELDKTNHEYVNAWRWADDIVERFKGMDREKFIQSRIQRSIMTFAVLKDGKWYERGSMGWWGYVSDEIDDWDEQFYKLFESLDDDTRLTVVDCHI